MVANFRKVTNFGEVKLFALFEEMIAVIYHIFVVLPEIQDVLKLVIVVDIFV